jgi:hypothetical protein
MWNCTDPLYGLKVPVHAAHGFSAQGGRCDGGSAVFHPDYSKYLFSQHNPFNKNNK